MGSHQQTAKMGEGSKQVRVDNWGIFFLQRLQMFFNKTDFCDLTLQFEGNVQLKVHRLVMNACTEYFHVLEQTCEMIDDVLVMPADLQADVVLPIVNFMYTGMLEFHMSIFDKLYKTANLMNITVLTKLLDAQKTPIAPLPKPTNKRNSQIPHTWNLQGKKISAKTSDPDLPATLPGRKLPVWKRKSAPTAIPHTIVPHFFPEQKRTVQVDPLAGFDNAPKPTRFEWPEDELSTLNLFDSTFDDISYTSKPLLTQDDEPRPSTSFDRIRETPDSSRRSANYDSSAVDMEDVKDYVKEQRIRSNMAEDDDDDGVDNDFDNCDLGNSNQESQKRKMKADHAVPMKRVRFNISEKENQIRPTKINITPTGKTAPDVDHTKIISEVLKKYPNLVKKNKNIRLKILAKTNSTPVPTEIKRPIFKKVSPKISYQTPSSNKIVKTSTGDEKNDEDGPWKCQRCSTPSDPLEFVLYYLYRKHMTDVHNEKFDSRMCKFCGHRSTKHNMLMYHQYTKHGVKPPLAYNFPKCSQCPYIALTEALLIKHKMNHTTYELQCVECKVTFTNQQALTSHIQITGHTGKSGRTNYDCQYCTKRFQSVSTLFAHIRMLHRDEARRDGIVSIDETGEGEEEEEERDHLEQQELIEEAENVEYITPEIRSESIKKEKVKILQDVKLPTMELQQGGSDALDRQNITLEPSSEAEALSNVASGIATSLGLVDVVVLDENQQYILHTDNQQGMASGESEFILPDLQDTQTFTTTQQVITSEQNVITQSMLHNSDIGSTDELVMVLTDHDYGDGNTEIINSENSNIVVLYSHPIEGQENQFITSQGNLMLTSQAGLIELRNSNAVVTSTSSQFITNASERSENTHIESIEMIQREINRHPDIKNEIHLVQNIKPASVHEVSDSEINVDTTIEPLSQQMEILDSEQSEPKEQEHEEIDVQSITVLQHVDEQEHVEFNTIPDLIPVNNTESNQETQETQESQEISEKVDENITSEVTEETVQEASEANEGTETEEQPVPMETNDVPSEAAQDTSEIQEQPEPNNIEEVNKDPEEPTATMDTDQTEEPKTEDANVQEVLVEKTPEADAESAPSEPQETAPTEPEPMEVDKEKENVQEEVETAKEPEESDESAENIQENSNEELDTTEEDMPPHVTADSQLEEASEVTTAPEAEKEPQKSPAEKQPETEATKIVETQSASKPTDNEDVQEKQEEQTSQTNTTESLPVDNVEDENSKSQDTDPQEQNESSELEVDKDAETKDEDDNPETKDEDDNPEAKGEDDNPETKNEDDNPDTKDEDSQPHDESSEPQDENSQTSHRSQDSPCSKATEPKYSRSNSNQSAKIILDDWDDTDSQQSDSKNGTVHKLIDDWDDDEDENKKGSV